jgi:serine/threonine protein kinase
MYRSLKLCSNTVKLVKVHESEGNIYLFLDYQGGGSIGDLLDHGLHISEDNARIIIE